MQTVPGRVTSLQSGFYSVQTESGRVVCSLRKKLKRRTFAGDVIAVGDDVEISLQSDGTGAIEAILPRHSELVRLDPTPKGMFRQIMLANPDQAVLVFACAQPEPHLRMLDRFLVICEKQQVPPVIVANKVDLVGEDQALEMFSLYPPLGYTVVLTSVRTGLGLDQLGRLLVGKISALAGPSGVGKSSLLNAIQPGLGLAIGGLRVDMPKGKHTTIVRELFPLQAGGFVADLPGLRSLALWDTQPEELDAYFPELRQLVADCRFSDCTHRDEPGCAVLKALAAGKVHPERYDSYLRLRQGE